MKTGDVVKKRGRGEPLIEILEQTQHAVDRRKQKKEHCKQTHAQKKTRRKIEPCGLDGIYLAARQVIEEAHVLELLVAVYAADIGCPTTTGWSTRSVAVFPRETAEAREKRKVVAGSTCDVSFDDAVAAAAAAGGVHDCKKPTKCE